MRQIICEKAKQLFEELGAKALSTNTILLVHIFFYFVLHFSSFTDGVGW